MLSIATIPDYLLVFGQFRDGHSKRGERSLTAWSVFSPLLKHLSRPKKTFTCVQAKKRELAEEIITPLEFKKEQ
jgi:hypothetical protein